MGFQFDMSHANFVAFLTAPDKSLAPRAHHNDVENFLHSLSDGGALISSTQGTSEDWTAKISNAARRQVNSIRKYGDLTAGEVGRILAPLRRYFSNYDLYALIIPSGSGHDGNESLRFFREIAMSSHSRGLVLMPNLASAHNLLQIVDPFPPLQTLAENPCAPPCVVFWTPLKNSCVLALDEGRKFFRSELITALEKGPRAVDIAIESEQSRKRAIRILHLSDLHFGTSESTRRRSWLKEHLKSALPRIDRVVVTGDLFDNPKDTLRASFDEFRADVENLTGNDLLVVPGNHDVRNRGNAFGPLGRSAEYVTDLRWNPVVFDDEFQTIFFSFNSSESGNFARGAVSEMQRLERARLHDREMRLRPKVGSYTKVALVHHHPFAYESEPTSLYERILASLLGGEERFIAFEHAEAFIDWCAGRGVSLILHGHKHVPRLTTIDIVTGEAERQITVVGCGSTTGVGGKPMCYDIITMHKDTKRTNVLFYHDEKGDGRGFGLQNVAVDLRQLTIESRFS